jgi:hypothetical protein
MKMDDSRHADRPAQPRWANHLIFNSCLKEFKIFEVNYNFINDKWTLRKFIAMYVQEEEKIKRNNGDVDSVNMTKYH